MNPERPHMHRDRLLKRWLTGDATSRSERELDATAQDDPFLAEALEGYRSMPESEHSESVTKLKARLRNRAEARNRGAGFYLLRIAAAGAVLLAAWLVFQQFDGQQAEAEMAVKQSEEKAAPTAEKIESTSENRTKEEVSNLTSDERSLNYSLNDSEADEKEIPNPMKEVAIADEVKMDEVRKTEPGGAVAENASEEGRSPQKRFNEPINEGSGTGESLVFSENERTANEPNPVVEDAKDLDVPSSPVDLFADEAIPPYEEQAAPESSAPMVHKIVGKVTNDFGDPLTGVRIEVVESKSGTVTDNDGYFAIETEANQPNLHISHIGYEDQNMAIRDEDFVNVQLAESEVLMDEVTVASAKKKAETGYGLPQPEGGFSKFEKYIRKNLRRPDGEGAGEVRLRFGFNEESKPFDFEILESLGEAFDEEAKRILREGPRWTGNTAERVTYSVKF